MCLKLRRLIKNKEIFYRLTSKGKFLYDEHEKRHEKWRKRDDEFFSRFTEKELGYITKFMTEFNQCLGEKIDEN